MDATPMSEQKPMNPNRGHEKAIDDALDAALSSPPTKSAPEVSFKRQWDDDLDAELEAAMAGFDPSSFDVRTPRTRAADRAHAPKENRGQEAARGPQKGKVIAIRGKSVFIDLAAKSEGVVPIEQFGNDLPNPG